VSGRVVSSIFFGGGTPSLLTAETVHDLLRGIHERIDVSPDAEISLEANPGTVERGRFAGYREAGVNRLSLGAQTFGARQLTALGRIHSTDDIGAAVLEANAAGLGNFNLDLMHGLPEQSVEAALEDVVRAIAMGPTHLSHYQLTMEPGTVFYSQPPPLPDEEQAEAIEAVTHAAIAAAGFQRYEVSAWAQPGAECRHNLNYWRYGDYLGVGAGAHGKRSRDGRIVRTERARGPREYMASVEEGKPHPQRDIPSAERPFEYFLNVLRLVEGFESAQFESATGVSIEVVEPLVTEAQERGLLEATAGGWRPTPLGLRFLNDLQGLFLVS
jgi:oxygen-independent coproporphyrinogen-3 oxidase